MTDSNDPSARYVLTQDAPYLANLAALWAVDPRLAAAIEGTDDGAAYRTAASKSGEPTLSVATSTGREIQLHSRYWPTDEAKQLVVPLKLDESVAFYVHGLGLGYHVEQLFARSGEEVILCVFEPDLLMFRAAFESRDYSNLIRSGRVLWFWREDKADLFARLTPHQPLITLGVERVVHPPSQ